MIIKKKTLQKAYDDKPQLKVKSGRIVAIDGTKADMSEFENGTEFFIVSRKSMEWIVDTYHIIQSWSA